MSKLVHQFFREKSSPSFALPTSEILKNLPKEKISQQAKIGPIWSP
jgi:hypothetical protein